MDDNCYACASYMADVNATADVSTAQLPSTWRQFCIDCLEADVKGQTLQAQMFLADIMAAMFLRQQGMPLSAAVDINVSNLPPSPKPDVSAVCHSCIKTWTAVGSSMSPAYDRNKLAHCHACLNELEPTAHEPLSYDLY
jgi:hypothetical protein